MNERLIIHICTQDNCSQRLRDLSSSDPLNRVIVHEGANKFNNEDEISHFSLMQSANILVSANSSFSHLAGLVGKAKVWYDRLSMYKIYQVVEWLN